MQDIGFVGNTNNISINDELIKEFISEAIRENKDLLKEIIREVLMEDKIIIVDKTREEIICSFVKYCNEQLRSNSYVEGIKIENNRFLMNETPSNYKIMILVKRESLLEIGNDLSMIKDNLESNMLTLCKDYKLMYPDYLFGLNCDSIDFDNNIISYNIFCNKRNDY